MLATSVHDLVATLEPQLRAVASQAGEIALSFFKLGAPTTARIWAKDKGSPVTEADVAVDTFLKIRLSQSLPEAAWLSEETADNPDRLRKRLVWIVDPIDGTRAFLSGDPDWSVAIALLADNLPVLGVVYAPAHERYYEAALGAGARANGAPIAVSTRADVAGARVCGPKPLMDAFEGRAGVPLERVAKVPSLALRLCRVADAEIDISLVRANAHDWDIAAADLILHEAGGRLTDLEGTPLAYNRDEPLHGELAATSARLHPAVIGVMTSPDGR